MINQELLSADTDKEIIEFVKEYSSNKNLRIKLTLVCPQCDRECNTVRSYKNHVNQCEKKINMQRMWNAGHSIEEVAQKYGFSDRIPENALEYTKDTLIKHPHLYQEPFKITELLMTGYRTTLHDRRISSHNYMNLAHTTKG